MRRWMSSVRIRTTAAAVALVGIALLIGGVTMVLSLRHALTDNIRTSAELRAHEIARSLTTDPGLRLGNTGDEQLVQIINQHGRVVASTPNVTGTPAIALSDPDQSTVIDVPFDDDKFLAVVDTTDGQLDVVVAQSLDRVSETTATVTRLLAIGLPALLLLMGGISWLMAGRALAPVRSMSREVDEISATQLTRRVADRGATDEIADLAATMNRMLDRLQQGHIRQQRLVSDASHELRSPIAAIRQHAEVAMAHPDRVLLADLADTVHAESLRLQGLVDDLLLLAKADEQTLSHRRQLVDLDDLVMAEATRLRATTTHTIDTTAVSAGRISADLAAMHRVVRNLADNSARYSRSRIAFFLSETGGTVRLDIDDDGPGIPLADRDRVFDRFVTVDDSRARPHGGAGLGLAIVRELVRTEGGAVSIADSPLGGTRISVRLPAQV